MTTWNRDSHSTTCRDKKRENLPSQSRPVVIVVGVVLSLEEWQINPPDLVFGPPDVDGLFHDLE